jgi:prevent-host-death family protein
VQVRHGGANRAEAGTDGNASTDLVVSYETYISTEPGMALDVDVTLTTGEARERFAELVNRAAFGKERILLTRRGKPLAVVVPVADLEHLEALEEAEDVRAATEVKVEAARTGEKPRAWRKVKEDLGL